MRWKYLIPATDADQATRGDALRAMDAWWDAFSENADALDAYYTDSREFDVVGFTRRWLAPVPGDLCWEYGPSIAGEGHRLIITPEGDHALRPMVDELIARAPRLPRWEFYGYRMPDSADQALRTAGAISRYAASHAMPLVGVQVGRHNRIDLTFQLSASEVDAHEGLRGFLFRVVEQLVGEELLDKWIGHVGPAEDDEAIATRPSAAVVPAERLKATVDAVIAAVREQLPPLPRHATAAAIGEDGEWISYSLTPPDEAEDYARWYDQYVGVTAEQALIFATRSGASFCSDRFSRVGETFCYLKIDGGDGLDPEHFADRGEVEDAINAALITAKLGCVVGGGTGRMYSYIDLALTDVHAAIDALRGVLRRGNINHRSWLLFHDADLVNEWVGLYDDAPAPPPDPNKEV